MSLLIHNLELCRHDKVSLLGPLNLSLEPGARVALVGESGSGKSLLAQAIMGMLPPGVHLARGCVEAFGCRMDQPSQARQTLRQRRIAWVPQDPLMALNPLVQIQDHLVLRPWVHPPESRQKVLEQMRPLLEHLHLPTDSNFLRRFPLEISGGQRQRVVLAMTLAWNPELLVLDEPTSALDPELQQEFLSLMNALHREGGLGWLWITHDLNVAAAVTDRVLVLYGGKVLEAGPCGEVLESPRHPYTRRLREASQGEPSTEGGFLDAPGRRPAGCPFRPRCQETQPTCVEWRPWQGSSEMGIRCNQSLRPY
ncbi:MAG: ABC transporter ATP-binding protein [Holophaga sp.]|nr:ABC transporter ATP-binding protein [Holophaga sp.]